jgi:hypothetical protein
MGLVEWLKAKALSSIPSTEKKFVLKKFLYEVQKILRQCDIVKTAIFNCFFSFVLLVFLTQSSYTFWVDALSLEPTLLLALFWEYGLMFFS